MPSLALSVTLVQLLVHLKSPNILLTFELLPLSEAHANADYSVGDKLGLTFCHPVPMWRCWHASLLTQGEPVFHHLCHIINHAPK